VDYIVVVNFGEAREIGTERGADADIVHGGW
jgi:hypothetical protein